MASAKPAESLATRHKVRVIFSFGKLSTMIVPSPAPGPQPAPRRATASRSVARRRQGELLGCCCFISLYFLFPNTTYANFPSLQECPSSKGGQVARLRIVTPGVFPICVSRVRNIFLSFPSRTKSDIGNLDQLYPGSPISNCDRVGDDNSKMKIHTLENS